jgi:hypothetical protein
MIQVAIITNEQKDILLSLGELQDFGKILPIQDANDNYFLSENEYYYFLGLWYLDELSLILEFITTLQFTEYEPKQQTNII